MICDVCGRDNADSLTFCQDCGRRLKSKSQRVVPPTPPSGMPKIELPAAPPPPEPPQAPGPPARPSPTDGGRLGTPAARLRPEAPSFSFAPPEPARSAPVASPAAPSPPAVPPAAAGHNTCQQCQGANPPGYRFCMTCGAPLSVSAASGAPPAPPARPAPQPAAPVAAASEEKIVGSPVVDIAAARSIPARMVTCPRCSGQCVFGTRFCKYCGAPLDEGAAPGPSPASAAVSSGDPPPLAPRPAPQVPLPPPPVPARAPEPVSSRSPVSAGAAHPPAPLRVSAAPVPAGVPRAPAPAPVQRAEARLQAEPQPSPAPRGDRSPSGKLVVIVEDGTEGKSFPLLDSQVDVGRLEGDIKLEDDLYVSPRHARLAPVGGRWILRDLDSTNHVYVRLRRPHLLRDGDLLLLGLEVLQFQIVNDGERGLGHATQHGTLLFGSPANPRHARLCQRTIEGITRDVYHLIRDETVIGRETGDIVFTADPFLSRRHAAIRHNPGTGEFVLADLESSNGTYVAIREEVPLSNGDFVRIGQHLFRVDISSAGPGQGRGANGG